MSVMQELGKVSVTPKGEFSAEITYERLDIIEHEGNSYIAVSDVPAGTELTDSRYWQRIASKGDKGDAGAKGPQGEPGPAGADGENAVVDATLTQAGQAADAAKTGEAIGKLKNDLDNQRKGINDGYEYDLLLTYSVGGFSSTTGVNTDNPIRIRTDNFYKPNSEKICNVLVKDGCQLYIQEFKYVAGTGYYESTGNSAFGYWITEDTTITLTPDYYYKMMIRKNVDEQVENPLSMAESIIFGKVSELNYIPSIINDHMCAEVNNLEFPVEWEIGGLNGGSGNNVDNATRIRTKEWINFGGLTEVTIKWNVGQIYIMSKENNSTHIVSSWLSPQEYKLTIDKGYVYRFMYQYTGNADISWSNRVYFLFDKKIYQILHIYRN